PLVCPWPRSCCVWAWSAYMVLWHWPGWAVRWRPRHWRVGSAGRWAEQWPRPCRSTVLWPRSVLRLWPGRRGQWSSPPPWRWWIGRRCGRCSLEQEPYENAGRRSGEQENRTGRGDEHRGRGQTRALTGYGAGSTWPSGGGPRTGRIRSCPRFHRGRVAFLPGTDQIGRAHV